MEMKACMKHLNPIVDLLAEDDEGAAFLLSILDEANLDDKDDLTIDW